MNRLNEIEARANAATEGPWYTTPDYPMVCADSESQGDEYSPELHDGRGFYSPSDAEFIAHARTDVPDMAAALRAVLEVHQDGGESQGYLDDGSYGDIPHCCTECGSLGEYGVPWPCATVTAIRQHIGDDK